MRNGRLSEAVVIADHKGFFPLRAPALDLGLAASGLGKGLELLLEDGRGWRIELGGAAGLAGLVAVRALVDVGRGARIESAGLPPSTA